MTEKRQFNVSMSTLAKILSTVIMILLLIIIYQFVTNNVVSWGIAVGYLTTLSLLTVSSKPIAKKTKLVIIPSAWLVLFLLVFLGFTARIDIGLALGSIYGLLFAVLAVLSLINYRTKRREKNALR